MTLKTLQEGLALMGASLRVHKDYIEIDFKGVRTVIDKNLTKDEVEVRLLFIPKWHELVKQALEEEQKGGAA